MLRLAKYAALAIGALVVMFCAVAAFSTVETRYECNGELKRMDNTRFKVLYIKLEEYRWWVGLWGESDGSLGAELPNEWVGHYAHIKKTADQLQIFNSKKSFAGNFSNLSKTLTLETDIGHFEGICRRIEK